MQRIFRNLSVVVGVLLCSFPALAADKPLEAIPQDAGVVVVWQKPTETVKKAVEFVNAVDPEQGRMLRPLSLGIGVAISNPELKGVDTQRDWYVAVFPKAEGDPGIVFAIPATDADAMKEGIEGDFTFASYEDWLLYSDDAALIETIQGQIDGDKKSIAALIDAESAAVMGRNDLSVFLNAPRLRVIYKDQLEKAENDFENQLGQVQNFAPPTPGINLKPMLDLYSQMFRGLMQSVKDTQGVTLGLSFAKAGVNFETQARVAADSETDKVLKESKKSELKKLGSLPAGSHVYAGVSGDINSLISWGTTLATAIYGDDDAAKGVEEAAGEMAKLDFGSYLLSFGIGGGDGGILRVANVIEVKPVDKMRDLSRKMVKSMGKFDDGAVKQEIELKVDAEEYGNRSADVVVTRQQVDPELDPLGIQTQLNRVLYGEEGQVQRIVYLQDSVAQTMGGGRPAMEKLLASLDAAENTGDAKADKAAAAAVRSQLPQQANVIALADLPLLVADLVQAVIQASPLPIPIDADGLKRDLGDKRSYVGLSVACDPQTAHVKLHVPVLQAQNMTKLVKTIREMTAQPQF